MAMFKATGILPVGTKLPVLKLGDTDHQRAEVLAIRQRKDGKPSMSFLALLSAPSNHFRASLLCSLRALE